MRWSLFSSMPGSLPLIESRIAGLKRDGCSIFGATIFWMKIGERQRRLLNSKWLDEDWEGPDPSAPADPERAIRRIAAAVLIRALLDARMRSPYVRTDARRFLEAQDESSREILRLLVQISGINRAWFRRRLVEFLRPEVRPQGG